MGCTDLVLLVFFAIVLLYTEFIKTNNLFPEYSIIEKKSKVPTYNSELKDILSDIWALFVWFSKYYVCTLELLPRTNCVIKWTMAIVVKSIYIECVLWNKWLTLKPSDYQHKFQTWLYFGE